MKYDPHKHHRRSIRLKGYDYHQPGAYFVTIVTYQRAPLFGEINGGVMHLNRFGEIVRQVWLDLPRHYPYTVLDAFTIMPNHVHGILVLGEETGRGGSVSGKGSGVVNTLSGKPTLPDTDQTYPYLPEIVRALKSFSARRINQIRKMESTPVWQRNYYEHIIRNEREYLQIKRYIQDNPLQWENDLENPARGR